MLSRRKLLLVLLAFGGLALLYAHPWVRSYIQPAASRRSGPSLLLVPAGCHPADRVEVMANGALIGVFGLPGKPRIHRILFEPSGDTLFEFRILRDGTLLYKPPSFRATVAPGDIFRCFFDAADTEPRDYQGPQPVGSSPAVASGVPSKVWCWFHRDRQLHSDNLTVTLHECSGDNISSFKDRARQKGYRIVKSWHTGFRLARPPHKTIVEAMLDVETWPEVRSASPQKVFVY